MKNLMDLAIIHKTEQEEAENPQLTDLSENYIKVDEIPFDFTRRRLSTLVQDKNGKIQMVTKGAVEEMLSICAYAEYDGEVVPLTGEIREKIINTVDGLNEKDFVFWWFLRKAIRLRLEFFGAQDECDMVMMGYLAFLDPPKESTMEAIQALKRYGVCHKKY